MKLKSTSVLALTVLLASTAAMAQATVAEPDYTLSYNAGVTTDYRFRGISQTSFDPAFQAGADFAHKSGGYIGLWASNVSWIKDYAGASKGTLEVDIYAGYKGAITPDLSYDLGLIRYQYPSNNAATNANTTEVYAALSYSIMTAKYSRSTGNFVANPNSSGSHYFEVAANVDLGNGFMLTPRVGHQSIPNVADNAGDYTDFGLTLAKDFGGGLSASIAAIGTDAKRSFYTDSKGNFLGKDALVVGLKYSF